MEIRLTGKQDVYIEVAERYKEYIRLGIIKVGEKLPSVRTVAGQLGINPNTVAKAYSLLEADGFIRSLPKKGAYVIYGSDPPSSNDYSEQINIIRQLKNSGIDRNTIIKLIEEVYDND
jgi:GntR family transcriptional regulator